MRGDQVSPKISGHVVVWQDRRNGNWDIYAYDFKTGKESPVCVADKDQTDPRIYGNTIVWVDERDDRKAIYMTTISGNDLEEVRLEEPVAPKGGDGSITIKLNGLLIATEVPPILVNDTTLIPARAVAGALGATVDWLEPERSVEITRGQVKVKVYPDKTLAFINGKQYTLPLPPQIINGCTMLPLRFLAETLGATVNWHEKEKFIEVRL